MIMKNRHWQLRVKKVRSNLNSTGYERPVVHIKRKLPHRDQNKATGINHPNFLRLVATCPFTLKPFFSNPHLGVYFKPRALYTKRQGDGSVLTTTPMY